MPPAEGLGGVTWNTLVESMYSKQVEYYLRDEPMWRQLCRSAHPSSEPPPTRWQRVKRKTRNWWSDARYAVGHWVAGPCPESDY